MFHKKKKKEIETEKEREGALHSTISPEIDARD